MNYYLEEKSDNEYWCIGSVSFEDNISGYYWIDEQTIHYLKERVKNNGSKYWVAYSGTFILLE